MSMIYSWSDFSATKSFAFTFTVGPPVKFCLDTAVCASNGAARRSFKRRRPLWDVDGGMSEGKKKRRLRLNLITSRLSRPFSAPATNIVDRGISKIAIWAKGRPSDKSLLRKAAIMNRVRRSIEAAKVPVVHQEELSRPAMGFRQVMHVQRPRYLDIPPPPSPLGLSNYDALDLEDEDMFDNENGEGDHAGSSVIYSDFNKMNQCSMVDGDEYDYLDELDGIEPEERPPPPLDERVVEMMREKERQKELYFVHFVA